MHFARSYVSVKFAKTEDGNGKEEIKKKYNRSREIASLLMYITCKLKVVVCQLK